MLKGNLVFGMRRPCACREGLPANVQDALDQIVEALHAEHGVPLPAPPPVGSPLSDDYARLRDEFEARERALVRRIELWVLQFSMTGEESHEPRH